MKLTVYDPNYFMPGESSFNLSVNIPPTIENIIITPINDGVSL